MANNTINKELQHKINIDAYFEVNLNDKPVSELNHFCPINDCVKKDNNSVSDTNGGTSQHYTSLKSSIMEAPSNVEIQDEKSLLISQVLELQNTLDDLSQRVDTVKVENLNLRSENKLLSKYLESLMLDSSVMQIKISKMKMQ